MGTDPQWCEILVAPATSCGEPLATGGAMCVKHRARHLVDLLQQMDLPRVSEIKVARDLYDQMRREVEPTVGYQPTFGAAFGFPIVIDDSLATGDFRVVKRGEQ